MNVDQAEYFQTVQLPVDFGPVGLTIPGGQGAFVLTAQNQNDVPALLTVPDADNRLRRATVNRKRVFVRHTALHPSTITLGGTVLRVVQHLSNGTFGSVCLVARDIPNGQEERFVLKEVNVEDEEEKVKFIKEGMINYILQLATAPGMTPFVPIIHKLFHSRRNGVDKLYSLTELMAQDVHTYLNALPIQAMDGGVFNIFNQCVHRLKELSDKFEFSHGDFKTNNCMFDHQDRVRLIDLGMARMTLRDAAGIPVLIQTDENFNQFHNESQDITLMATMMLNCTRARSAPGTSQQFLRTIDNGYGLNYPLSDYDKIGRGVRYVKPNGGILYINDMGRLYELLDNIENPAGTFQTVLDQLAIADGSAGGNQPIHTNGPVALGFNVPPLTAPRSVPLWGGAKLKRRNKTKRRYRKNGKSSSKSRRLSTRLR
jgi:serine/threonine protein kinase